MSPKVSIIVPAYNAESTIERCILSVVAQSYKNFELIIVNDGSTDSTRKICTTFLQDNRIKLFDKHNSGVSAARNTGIDLSTGKYVLFLDADDTLSPTACEYYVHIMDKGVDLCIADFHRIKNGKVINTDTMNLSLIEGIYNKREFTELFEILYKHHYINSPWGRCYRRDKMEDRFTEKLNIGEDLLFNLSYLLHCDKIMILDEKLYQYYVQDVGTLSSSFRMESFSMLQYVYKKTLFYCKSIGINEPIQEVDKKYVLDMTVMFERLARYENFVCFLDKISKIFSKYELTLFFESKKINAGIKFKIEKYLLQTHKFRIFWLVARILLWIKTLYIQ